MESISRRYGVDRDRLRPALLLFGAAALVVLLLAAARLVAGDGQVVAVLQLGVLAACAYVALVHLSYEVELHDDGGVVFHSVLWSRRTHASRIERVRRGAGATVAFKYAGGTARVPRRIEHLNDLIFRLRALNTTLDVDDGL